MATGERVYCGVHHGGKLRCSICADATEARLRTRIEKLTFERDAAVALLGSTQEAAYLEALEKKEGTNG